MSADDDDILYVDYTDESMLQEIQILVAKDLSEPYSVFTYRYFLHSWPSLCVCVYSKNENGRGENSNDTYDQHSIIPIRCSVNDRCHQYVYDIEVSSLFISNTSHYTRIRSLKLMFDHFIKMHVSIYRNSHLPVAIVSYIDQRNGDNSK